MAGWGMLLGVVTAGLSLVALVAAAIYPVQIDVVGPSVAATEGHESHNYTKPNLSSLLEKMAGRGLIRPPQVVAAVKDTGAAARLAKSLKLQGVVELGGSLVAYIEVEKRRVQALRKGETVLGFVVRDIGPGRVTLSLEGVEVILGH